MIKLKLTISQTLIKLLKSRMLLASNVTLRVVIYLSKINNLTCANDLYWFNDQNKIDNLKKINPGTDIKSNISIKCCTKRSDLS